MKSEGGDELGQEAEDILVTIADSIGQITFNLPDGRNALRPQTMAEVSAAVDALTADDDVRAIILNANGRHFCAGADFRFLDRLTDIRATEIKAEVYEYFQGAARRLYHCPKPTLAVVQGAAVTVGCELALACDFRILAEDAYLQESWVRLGLMPPLGGLFLLPRLIGLGRAMQMVVRGDPVPAADALNMGLASEVVPAADLQARGLALATELAAIAPLAYATIKEGLHQGLETTIDAQWAYGRANQALLLKSEDFEEGLQAVKTRRQPEFRGR